MGAIRNVTETKSLIQQLKKQNSYLSLAEKISNSGHWRYDVQTGKMFWSTELYRIYGTEPQDFVPDLDRELAFHIEERTREYSCDIKKTVLIMPIAFIKSRPLFNLMAKKCKIETIGEVEVDSQGNVIALFGICRDISKSEETFEKLKLLALVNYTIRVPIFLY